MCVCLLYVGSATLCVTNGVLVVKTRLCLPLTKLTPRHQQYRNVFGWFSLPQTDTWHCSQCPTLHVMHTHTQSTYTCIHTHTHTHTHTHAQTRTHTHTLHVCLPHRWSVEACSVRGCARSVQGICTRSLWSVPRCHSVHEL